MRSLTSFGMTKREVLALQHSLLAGRTLTESFWPSKITPFGPLSAFKITR